jgi:hypothetical protein
MAKLSFGKNLWTIGLLSALASASFLLGSPAHAATYNVKTYGAKGDGITDDSQAIANAIAAASRAKGNTVVFPKGAYLIGSAHPFLDVGTTMVLLGESGSQLDMTDSNAQLYANGGEVTFDGLSVANTGSGFPTGITFYTTNGGSVRRCTFTGWEDGVTVTTNAKNVVVENNTFSVPTNDIGVRVQNNCQVTISNNQFNSATPNYGYGVFSDAATNTIAIKNNKFNSLGYAVYAIGDSSNPLPTIVASSNIFESCYYGYYCEYVSALYIDTDAINNSTYGVYAFYNKTLKVNRCTINSPSTYGLYVGDSVNTTEISNNILTNLTGAVGISVSNNASVTNNTLTGPGFSALGIYAYNFQRFNSVATITGNTIKGVLYGVKSYETQHLTVENNNISQCQANGIYTYNDAHDIVDKNDLRDCGLSIGDTYAVIYLNGNTGSGYSYVVTNNTYTAKDKSTANLTDFVYVYGSNVTLKNNQTNTGLPSYP